MQTHFVLVAIGPMLLGLNRAPQPPFLAGNDQQQLPRVMHTKMKEFPRITVGVREGDLRGADNRVLQAAVDYIAKLGGGVVEIRAGEYRMPDGLHLRPTGILPRQRPNT